MKRQDELGQIAGNFNLFLEKLTDIVRKTREALFNTENNALALSEVSEQTMNAILEVKVVILSVKDGSHNISEQQVNLDEAVNNTLLAMKRLEHVETQMTERSREIERPMSRLVEAVKHLNNNPQDMKEEIRKFTI